MKVRNTHSLLTFDARVCYLVTVTPGEAPIKPKENGLKSDMEGENGALIIQ